MKLTRTTTEVISNPLHPLPGDKLRQRKGGHFGDEGQGGGQCQVLGIHFLWPVRINSFPIRMVENCLHALSGQGVYHRLFFLGRETHNYREGVLLRGKTPIFKNGVEWRFQLERRWSLLRDEVKITRLINWWELTNKFKSIQNNSIANKMVQMIRKIPKVNTRLIGHLWPTPVNTSLYKLQGETFASP